MDMAKFPDVQMVVVQLFNAGVDMNMVPENWKDLYRNTLRQVRNGEISIERLDDAVRRIISVKQKLGLFNGKMTIKLTFQ